MGSKNSSNKNDKSNKTENLNDKNFETLDNKNETLVEAYERLDKEICLLESLCPGPRLATAEAWIQHLQTEINLPMPSPLIQNNDNENNKQNNSIDEEHEKIPENKEIEKLALRIGILKDKAKAQKEEEFFANLNRADMQRITKYFYKEIIAHTQSRMNHLIIIYNKLSSLYVEQDGLIASINGGLYSSELEETFDRQLESERDIRDKLGSAVEQWRISAILLKTSLKFAQKAIKLWETIDAKLSSETELLNVALECRNCILASLTTLDCAQLALPQVDMKFISPRQITAMEHINIYILTDITDETRSSHIQKVLKVFQENLENSLTWFFQMFETTLKKDFKESEKKCNEIALSLREVRLQLFSKLINKNPDQYKNIKKL